MTYSQLIAGAVLVAAGLVAPSISVAADRSDDGVILAAKGASIAIQTDGTKSEKRGRGRGRGGDRDRSSDDSRSRSDDSRSRSDDSRSRSDDSRSRSNDGSSGRSRPRIPGGSGCDDARDLIEHPECRG